MARYCLNMNPLRHVLSTILAVSVAIGLTLGVIPAASASSATATLHPATATTAKPVAVKAKGITSKQLLKNAPIPAYCLHEKTRLEGYHKSFGPDGSDGFAALDVDQAIFVPLGKSKTNKYAVVPLSCSAGGVIWPDLVVVYQKSTARASLKLVGWVESTTKQAHSYVRSLSFNKNTKRVVVHWKGCNGGGFASSCEAVGSTTMTSRSTLYLKSGDIKQSKNKVLTIDYREGSMNGAKDNGFYTGPGDSEILKGLPASLKKYVHRRWAADVQQCGASMAWIGVIRYSHKGYALADGGSCGDLSAPLLFYRKNGRWNTWKWAQSSWNLQCSDLTKKEKKLLSTVHGWCYVPYADPDAQDGPGTRKFLGTWPRSGE